LKATNPFADTMQIFNNRASLDLLDRLLYTDQKTYLVELIRKQDTMSMAASIESRVPFLDHKLVEFAAQVPPEHKIRHHQGKYLVKQAMRQILPEAIIKRKKMGFPVPINQWFRGESVPVVRSVLASKQIREHGIFNVDYVARLLDEHVHGSRDHSDALWTVLNFELWTRIYLDGESWSSVSDELTDSGIASRKYRIAEVA